MSNIKIIVESRKIKDKREYEKFDEFVKDLRFWFSSGASCADRDGSDEFLFLKVKESLEDLNSDGCKTTVSRSGLLFTFVYDKFSDS